MRRIALLLAWLAASVVLVIFLVPARAAAPTAAGLHKGAGNGAAANEGVQLIRRGGGGFRGGGFRGGGFRGGRAFRGGFHGGRAFAFRGGRAFRGGFHGGRAFAFRGGRAFRGGFHGGRAFAFRGGRTFHSGFRGRRVWRGPRWGWGVGAAALAAPYYYGGYGCPLVRRTVWTPYGWRVRWVRRCY
jgi:hypothetical protein